MDGCALLKLCPPSSCFVPEGLTPRWAPTLLCHRWPWYAVSPQGLVIGGGPGVRGLFCHLVTVYNATGFEEASKCFPGRVPSYLRSGLDSAKSVSRERGQNLSFQGGRGVGISEPWEWGPGADQRS